MTGYPLGSPEDRMLRCGQKEGMMLTTVLVLALLACGVVAWYADHRRRR